MQSAGGTELPLLPGIGAVDRRVAVDPTQQPWDAIAKVQTNIGTRCTGALIASGTVLTAAHCLYNRSTRALLQAGSLTSCSATIAATIGGTGWSPATRWGRGSTHQKWAARFRASIATETKRGTRLAISDMERYDEIDREVAARIRATTYTAEQILDDWFPPEPQG
jgi:hypothetical protein